VSYHFKASETFWRNFYRLADRQKAVVRQVWKIFKANPFDTRLGVHKIHALSAKSGKTIHALPIDADLRAVFFVEGDTVFTVDIGTHAIYRT
jgi:mRNA-degrading endonuclease YafQ of YafQ-DinJ toxin-antitoxin module